jgi:Na+/H+ antiporter NhaD/arsenite permease-like protein
MLIAIFALVYLGMLVGGIPGSKVDRTGVALLGAILMMVVGEVTPERAVEYLDVPTLALLFSMMVLSAQLRLGGFYAAVVRRFGMAEHSPRALLAIVILVAAVLAAVFTNDVVALAIAPVLLAICRVRGLRPLPFLLALACATNVGSAATLIGNPQNILIGQALRLHFARYALIALLPTVLGLAVIWGVIYLLDRDALQVPGGTRHVVALAAAAVVLLSKQFHTREMLGLVDWELLVLFGGLFVVNGAFLDSGLMADAERWLAAQGMDARNPAVLFLIAPLLSITVSNVPAVMLLLPLAVHPIAGPALALSSTLAGNALIVGSIANIIVVEQAARGGVAISWRDHARVGLPVTVLTLVVAGGVLLLFR